MKIRHWIGLLGVVAMLAPSVVVVLGYVLSRRAARDKTQEQEA